MTTPRLIASLILLAGILAIIVAGFRRRILMDRKLNELLPDEPGIRRIPLFGEIVLHTIPDTENGRKFLAYHRKVSRETGVVAGVSVATIIAARVFTGFL